jgi:hypothetical protein
MDGKAGLVPAFFSPAGRRAHSPERRHVKQAPDDMSDFANLNHGHLFRLVF